jgi:predicted NUDIX family NTP pyrophosphohydrolase
MAAARSAGLLVWRRGPDGVEVLIGHMGGPYWAKKDDGGWSIPKGEHDPDEDDLTAARREFAEEIGHAAPDGDPYDLGESKQSTGKIVHAWAVEGDLDATTAVSNTFTMEWPPGSGRMREFPEFDRSAWFDLPTATRKLVKGQVPFVLRLAEYLEEPLDAVR